jgi:hypothetical protein
VIGSAMLRPAPAMCRVEPLATVVPPDVAPNAVLCEMSSAPLLTAVTPA